MNLSRFKKIKINSHILAKHKNYDKYDEYLKAHQPEYYENLYKREIPVIDNITIKQRMEDAVYFFASKGVGELTQILNNFSIDDDIKIGLQKYFGPDHYYNNMNKNLQASLGDKNLTFNDILNFYKYFNNNSDNNSDNIINKYIYNTLNAFTKTTPSKEKFYVFRCYQKLVNGAPLLDSNGIKVPNIYLNQFTSTSILLRYCDFWCTPSPINVDNTTNPTNPAAYFRGNNSIICIEIPIGTRGISLINHAEFVSGQLTATYSEFEYLLPPCGYLVLTTEIYNYTSVTRQKLQDYLINRYGTFPDLPITFDIPIYKYEPPDISDNRVDTSTQTKLYKYIIPKLNIFTISGMNYVRHKTNRLSNWLIGNTYVPPEGGRRLRKQSRKQTRKQSRKQTRKQSRKQHKKKI